MRFTKSEAIILVFVLLQTAALCNSFPLSTKSRWIIDEATGKRVKLACVNWASHLKPMFAEGLQKQPLSYIVSQIKATGFNCVRFTWPTFMITRPEYGNLTVSQSLDKLGLKDAKAGVAKNNPQFLDMNVIEVHKAVVNELGRNGLMAVVDNHISEPNWCCIGGDGNGFFGDANFDPNEWLRGLETVATMYKCNPTVVAMSIRNELRGERENEKDWYKYMQQGAATINRINPRILVVISGLNYDTTLGFLKSKPFDTTIRNKIVFEAHWYTVGTSAEQWEAQTNLVCANMLQGAEDSYLFLIRGNNSFPLYLSEWGMDETGANEADNRYMSCFLSALVANDIEWALWGIHGSYMLREGIVNMYEPNGILDFDWVRPKNLSFVKRLHLARQVNQDSDPCHPMSYVMFHPLTGQCVHVGKTSNIVLSECTIASRWEHQEDGPIKLVGSPKCLVVAEEGGAARVSDDCTGNSSKWKIASRPKLHLATQNAQGSYLCLENNAAHDATIVTKKCLCLAEDLADTPTCDQNPQVQWFKLVPINV